MSKLNISLAQMIVVTGHERRNVETMHAMAAEAARRGSQVVLLPELWSSGYAYDNLSALAAPTNSGAFAEMANAARDNKICIVGSVPEKRGVGINNSAALFSPGGQILGVYRKIHLFAPMGEARAFTGGQAPLNLELPWGRTGLAICYDLRFPEMFRRYGVEGARLVLLPAAWPQQRLDHWGALIRARAIENQYFVAACNSVGEAQTGEGKTRFGGHSMIIDPWGETVIEAGAMPGLYTAEIALERVDEVRERIPVFQDRRPETYGLDDIMSRLEL